MTRPPIRDVEPHVGLRQDTQNWMTEWPEPLDFLADGDMTGAPELRPEHLPDAIVPFVFDNAVRMGVDPAAVALAALVSLASVMDDEWCIQPKQNDTTWTESPRIWGAIVGDPSMLKTPILKITTAPIDKMEAQARDRYNDDMRRYRCEMKAWKDAGSHSEDEPKHPRLDRWLVEGATTEAISEVLRDDCKATQRAPAGKVLIRQDEMSEWIAGFDRYRSGGKGGSDRGAYLRLYNGGRYTIDRIQRGTFAISNWSRAFWAAFNPGRSVRLRKTQPTMACCNGSVIAFLPTRGVGKTAGMMPWGCPGMPAYFPSWLPCTPAQTAASCCTPKHTSTGWQSWN